MKRKVLHFPDGFLRKEAKHVDPSRLGTKPFKRMVLTLMQEMYSSKAIGIAAPQMGYESRVICIDARATSNRDILEMARRDGGALVLINPTLISVSTEKEVADEGCLSFPDTVISVPRWQEVEVHALNLRGELVEIKTNLKTEFLGRVLQHEIDHLDGKLMVDYVNMEDLDVRD